MRYVIGVSVYQKGVEKPIETGIFGRDSFKCWHIWDLQKPPSPKIWYPVIPDAETVSRAVKWLNNQYARYSCEGCHNAIHPYYRKFYPLKLDTKEFPYRLSKDAACSMTKWLELPGTLERIPLPCYPLLAKPAIP